MPDSRCRRLTKLAGDLAPDDVVTTLERKLGDAGTHRTEPDNADRPNLHGWEIYAGTSWRGGATWSESAEATSPSSAATTNAGV